MQRQKHLSHPALLPLWKSLERDWLLQLIAIMVVLVIGFSLTLLGVQTFPIVLLMGSTLVFVSFYLLYQHFRKPSPLLQLQDFLYERPDKIVWIYSIVHEHHPFGFQVNQRGIIYFKFANGDEMTAYLPPEKIRMISKVLSRALPNTVFGYTKERAAQYRENPRYLNK